MFSWQPTRCQSGIIVKAFVYQQRKTAPSEYCRETCEMNVIGLHWSSSVILPLLILQCHVILRMSAQARLSTIQIALLGNLAIMKINKYC